MTKCGAGRDSDGDWERAVAERFLFCLDFDRDPWISKGFSLSDWAAPAVWTPADCIEQSETAGNGLRKTQTNKTERQAGGIQWALLPMLDVAREPALGGAHLVGKALGGPLTWEEQGWRGRCVPVDSKDSETYLTRKRCWLAIQRHYVAYGAGFEGRGASTHL